MQSQQMTVPFDRLVRDDAANVRKKYGADAIEEMKASILAHGIIQPIAARPPQVGDADLGGQLYRIFAGGRRWVAMGELVKEGKIGTDYGVPIIIREVGDTEATELSLAENLVREQMTPADEFRAFAKLVDGGQAVADVALHFGQTERYVKGRLALARLHPEILAAFEEGKLNFAAACAYTLNPDPEVQVKHFRDTAKATWQRESYQVKHAMRAAGVRADSRVAQFIGEDAYRAAGGVVTEDLFGEEVLWTSGELIDGLKSQAIEKLKAEALAEGWSFFATAQELGIGNVRFVRVLEPDGSDLTEDEVLRMEAIAEEIEGGMEDDPDIEKLEAEYAALEARNAQYSTEQKAKAGMILDAETLDWKVGYVKAEASGGDNADEPLAAAAKAPKDPLTLTQPLKDIIGNVASDALSAGVMANPHKALALVTAMLATADVYGSSVGRPSRIKVERMSYGGTDDKKLSIAKLLGEFDKLSPEELLKRFAGFAAQTVDLTEAWFQKDYTQDNIREKTRRDFMEAFAADPVEAFDADAWFTSCTKPMIEAAAKEMGFLMGGGKKADMARVAAEKARETGWLPGPLRLKGHALKGKKPAG
jgi:ParB family chromosome partitioning protein